MHGTSKKRIFAKPKSDYSLSSFCQCLQASQESRSTYSQDRRSHDKFPPRSQDRNGHGRSQLRHEPSDVVMSSQNAAEERYDNHTHVHSQSNSRHCACGREVDNEPSTYPGKRTRANRSPTPVSDDDMGSQRGYSQEQEKPKKKRNIRKIPGRFTALDSSDEEEDQRQHDLRVVSSISLTLPYKCLFAMYYGWCRSNNCLFGFI